MEKNSTLSIILLLICSLGQAQVSDERYIEVTGEGSTKVDPNIIYLSIELREYKKEGKIVKLEELEARLTKVIETIGISSENLKVYASSGRQYDLKKLKSNLLVGKRYRLKLEDLDLINPLLSELSEANIFAVSVTEVTHTDIEKFKTEAKTKAIHNAKDKAELLTSSLSCKLGKVLQIRETELVDLYPVQALQGRVAGVQIRGASSYYSGGYDKIQTNNVDFEQIVLTYKIVVKFELE